MEILNVTKSVLVFLREKIITGELKPGEKLNEYDLSAKLGISRPPLREAFRLLERDHLVVNVPRKGTYVPEITITDVTEVSQIREMIQCYAIDLLKASNVRDLPNVTTALNRALNQPLPLGNVAPEELSKRIKIFLDFHNSLVKSTGNSLLVSMYEVISFNLARCQFIYLHNDSTAKHSLNDHTRILECIGNGDYDQAKDELKKHINYTKELVKSRISQPVMA